MTGSAVASSQQGAGAVARSLRASRRRVRERAIKVFLAACAVLSVLTTTAIVFSLLGPTVGFFREVSIREFFTGSQWFPAQGFFGVLPLIVGTLNVVGWALLIAIPVGIASAIYLSEYAPKAARRVVKPILEVLAGIPTVAIGFFGVSFVVPLLRENWPGSFLGGPPGFFMAGGAAICMALMIIPIISSIAEDALSAVPRAMREGAYALGATKARVAIRVVFPAALSGVVAAIVLGVSRAIGETMIVLMVAGNNPNITLNPVDVIQAMTAYLGITATGDIATGTVEYDTVFAVGALLFAITLVMNLISIRLVRRYREVYE